jgi:hypothetical protein
MFAQFRHQYPMGSLTSELLQIHEGKFIVRAIVQVGNATLSTGMSAAHSIEQAEDQARIRALVVLGIEEQSGEAHLISIETVTPQFQPSSDYFALSEASLPSTAELGWESNRQSPPSAERRSQRNPISRQTEDLEQSSLFEDVDDPEVLQMPASVKSDRRHHQSFSASPPKKTTKESYATPIDLSEVIAQTDVELKRLGWNHPQGRRYLEQTYQKKSRQHLTDAELLDFLDYLKSQPSPSLH